jgi:MFS family permease
MTDAPETTQDARSPLWRLFTSRSFVALFVSNALGFGGEQMRLAAQSWWILDEGGSKTEMGVAAGIRVIPVVLLTLYAGVLVDRVGGRRVLILERILLILLAAITGAILLFDQVEIWHVVVLSTIAGSTIALGTPATQTLVPEVVPEKLLQPANSMNQLGHALGRTLGPLAAGALIAIRSAALALFGLAAVYGVALLITFGISTSGEKTNKTSGSALRQIADGLTHIRQNPVLFWILFSAISLTFYAFIFPVVPVYARESLGVGEVQYGLMWGALAVGQASGALIIAARGGIQRKTLAVVVGSVLFAIGLIGMGLSTVYWLSLVFLVINGMAHPLTISSWLTLLQQHSKPAFRGRVMAVYAIAMQGTSAGWLLGGIALDLVGIMGTIIITVVGSMTFVLIPVILSKEIRRL